MKYNVYGLKFIKQLIYLFINNSLTLNTEKSNENEINQNPMIMFNTSIVFSSFFHWALDFV